jgi:hypothetical protein
MSLFYEDAGDDRYNEGLPLVAGEGMLGPVILATATGQGHDFSVGVLVDSAGNDHYVAPGLGVGGGNDNGIGYFIDAAGDDRYDVPDGTTFGRREHRRPRRALRVGDVPGHLHRRGGRGHLRGPARRVPGRRWSHLVDRRPQARPQTRRTWRRPGPELSPMTQNVQIGTEGELLPGTSYRLLKRLGGGGMGSVYIAEHTALGRRDAVKLLAPHIAEDEQAMKRLEREARATAALANPHIIDIYTLGLTTDKRPYVAMRLIRGESLKALIDREKRVDVDRAWLLLRQVCVALQSAHEAGIIHRDLKPENLMVEARDSGDFVTILDFGIAKVEAETEQRLTQDGQVIGTPGYMAPEQALGRAVDGRADQYSIGAIFYELVSGGSPTIAWARCRPSRSRSRKRLDRSPGSGTRRPCRWLYRP